MNAFTIIPILFAIASGWWFYACAAGAGAKTAGRVVAVFVGAAAFVLIAGIIPKVFGGVMSGLLRQFSDPVVIVGVFAVSFAIVFVLGLAARGLFRPSSESQP